MVDFARLKALGDLERLYELLHNHLDPLVRSQAAQTLGELKRGAAAPSLVQSLGDQVWEVRAAAKEALTHLGEEALPALEQGLKAPDPEARHWVGETLCAIGGPASYGLLRRLILESPDTRLRIEAVAALATAREEFAYQTLMLALGDEAWEVRRGALEALGRLGVKEALDTIRSRLVSEPNDKVQAAGQAVVELLQAR